MRDFNTNLRREPPIAVSKSSILIYEHSSLKTGSGVIINQRWSCVFGSDSYFHIHGRDLLGTQNRTVYSVIKKIRSDSPG